MSKLLNLKFDHTVASPRWGQAEELAPPPPRTSDRVAPEFDTDPRIFSGKK